MGFRIPNGPNAGAIVSELSDLDFAPDGTLFLIGDTSVLYSANYSFSEGLNYRLLGHSLSAILGVLNVNFLTSVPITRNANTLDSEGLRVFSSGDILVSSEFRTTQNRILNAARFTRAGE